MDASHYVGEPPEGPGFRLYRDGILIDWYRGFEDFQILLKVDSPAAGPHTYEVRAFGHGNMRVFGNLFGAGMTRLTLEEL